MLNCGGIPAFVRSHSHRNLLLDFAVKTRVSRARLKGGSSEGEQKGTELVEVVSYHLLNSAKEEKEIKVSEVESKLNLYGNEHCTTLNRVV